MNKGLDFRERDCYHQLNVWLFHLSCARKEGNTETAEQIFTRYQATYPARHLEKARRKASQWQRWWKENYPATSTNNSSVIQNPRVTVVCPGPGVPQYSPVARRPRGEY